MTGNDHSAVDSAPRTMVEQTLRAFAEHEDAIALTVDVDGAAAEQWTYRQLVERVHREAHRLDDLGVDRGSVVAVMTGDTPASFVLRWASNVLGAAVTVLADGYSPSVLVAVLRTIRADLLITDTARHHLAVDAAQCAGIATVVDIEATPPPVAPSPMPVRAMPEDVSSIPLTGGSTGVPKGVPRFAALPPNRGAGGPFGGSTLVHLLCTPVAHLGGTVALRIMAAGGHVVLQPGFDPARVCAAISQYRISLMFLLPQLLYRLLDHPGLAATDTSSLRSVNVGGAPASPTRLGEAVDRFGPIVAQGYGTIEATNVCWLSPEELTRPELRSTVGRPISGVMLSIRDDAGADVPRGHVGEVWVQAPGMMPGYVNAPAENAAAVREGWFDTGDLGFVDDEGYLSLVGRSKDVIFTERARLYPNEIEGALLSHPAVAAAAVFAEQNRDGVETAAAAVVVRPGHNLSHDQARDQILGWVRDRRGPNEVPSSIHLVEDLPATPSGKLDRAALRKRIAAGINLS